MLALPAVNVNGNGVLILKVTGYWSSCKGLMKNHRCYIKSVAPAVIYQCCWFDLFFEHIKLVWLFSVNRGWCSGNHEYRPDCKRLPSYGFTPITVIVVLATSRLCCFGENKHKNNGMSAQLVIFHVPIFRFLNPFGMFLGGSVVALIFMGSVWAGENKAIVKNFKKKNPTLFVAGVMVTSYFVLSLFGGVLVFIFGITFPLLCKCQCIPQDHSPAYIQINCVFFFFSRYYFKVYTCHR